jgi:uncharacterized iron-regulated protein
MDLTRLEHRIASFPSRGKEIASVRFTGTKQSTQNQGKESLLALCLPPLKTKRIKNKINGKIKRKKEQYERKNWKNEFSWKNWKRLLHYLFFISNINGLI